MDRGIRDSRSACPQTWCKTQSVLLPPLKDLHFTPSGHRSMDFVCVPSITLQFVGPLSNHHCVVHEIKQATVPVLRLRVVQLDIIFSGFFLMVFGFSTSKLFTLCCECVTSTSCVVLRREEERSAKGSACQRPQVPRTCLLRQATC